MTMPPGRPTYRSFRHVPILHGSFQLFKRIGPVMFHFAPQCCCYFCASDNCISWPPLQGVVESKTMRLTEGAAIFNSCRRLPVIHSGNSSIPGVYTAYVQFPDGFCRVYRVFVCDKITSTTKNLFEKPGVYVKACVADDLLVILKNKIRKGSAALVNELPKGFNGVAIIDFWNEGMPDINGNHLIWTSSQYLFSPGSPATTEAMLNGFFNEFIDLPSPSPVFYHSAGLGHRHLPNWRLAICLLGRICNRSRINMMY